MTDPEHATDDEAATDVDAAMTHVSTTAALVDWVAAFVGRIESTNKTDLVWCARWWEHSEVVDRLLALHVAYEDAAEEGTVSNWWIVHWGGHRPAFETLMRTCKHDHTPSATLTAPAPPADWSAAP